MNDINIIKWGHIDEIKKNIPKIVWIYWNGLSSETVDICLKTIKSKLKGYEINVLNDNNLKYYLENLPQRRDDFPIANYSDLIRLALLKQYGGVWIDASTYITDNFDWLELLQENHKAELIGFYSDISTSNLKYPILENYFLATTKSSLFINRWYEDYLKCYTSPNPVNYFNEIKDNLDFMQNIGKAKDYLLPYLSAIKLMRESQDYRLLMMSANDMPHFYYFGRKMDYKKFVSTILLENSNPYPKIIKFTGFIRRNLDNNIRLGKFSKRSVFFSNEKYSYYLKYKLKGLLNYMFFIKNNLIKKYL
ncbi:capsular polysaccharide synthesis protein [Empedobacter sp. ULE_I140]